MGSSLPQGIRAIAGNTEERVLCVGIWGNLLRNVGTWERGPSEREGSFEGEGEREGEESVARVMRVRLLCAFGIANACMPSPRFQSEVVFIGAVLLSHLSPDSVPVWAVYGRLGERKGSIL
jgi:hypothetical protein